MTKWKSPDLTIVSNQKVELTSSQSTFQLLKTTHKIIFYFNILNYIKVRLKLIHLLFYFIVHAYTLLLILYLNLKKYFQFGYGINFKYEGMLPHSFGRFYAVTKLIWSTIDDIKISPITIDMECSYLYIQLDMNTHAVKHLPNIRNFCSKIILFFLLL